MKLNSGPHQPNPKSTRFQCVYTKTSFRDGRGSEQTPGVTRQEAIIDREAALSECQQDIVQTELPVDIVSTNTIENYLKDLMTIPHPRVDNSDLLDGIDHVCNSITDCINLDESALCRKKLNINHEKISPQVERTGDIF